jgi:hypothetical protein
MKIILSSTLGTRASHPDSFLGLSQTLYANNGTVGLLKEATALLLHILQNSVFISAFPFDII